MSIVTSPLAQFLLLAVVALCLEAVACLLAILYQPGILATFRTVLQASANTSTCFML